MKQLVALLTLVAVALTSPAEAHNKRSRSVAHEFQAGHPCPATGLAYGRCPGYVRDHIWPLCAHGTDAVGNMQWQTIAEAKIKDLWERTLCRARK